MRTETVIVTGVRITPSYTPLDPSTYLTTPRTTPGPGRTPIFVNEVACVKSFIPKNSPNKGNYLCQECYLSNFGAEEMLFIRSSVNQNVGIWRPKDLVTITNGSTYATFSYQANGNFFPEAIGDGIGPGTAVNHDGSGNPCK